MSKGPVMMTLVVKEGPMRSRMTWRLAAVGLLLSGAATTPAQSLTGSDPRSGREPAPVPVPTRPAPPKGGEDRCHGTTVEFVDSPREAAEKARKEQKLVFVLHVSGHFEDPRFT